MEILNEENEENWQELFEQKEISYPQQSIHWKRALTKSYDNLIPYYFVEIKGNKIIEGLPFFHLKSKLFGNKMISLPFIDFGGFLGIPQKKFINEILEYYKKNFGKKIDFIEIRLNDFNKDFKKIEKTLKECGFEKQFQKNQTILELKTEDEHWNNFDRVTKKAIKKAMKSNLRIKEISSKEELKKFYFLYRLNMKNFGTPHHSLRFFENLMHMPSGFEGFNCYKEDKIIASLILIHSKNYAYAAYAVADKEYLKYQPYELLHWEAIKWAINQGIRHFDIGQCDVRSQEGGHAAGIWKFKKKWNGRVYEKFYFRYSLNKKDRNEKIKSEKEKLSHLWKKLPHMITNLLGPRIIPQLGV